MSPIESRKRKKVCSEHQAIDYVEKYHSHRGKKNSKSIMTIKLNIKCSTGLKTEVEVDPEVTVADFKGILEEKTQIAVS